LKLVSQSIAQSWNIQSKKETSMKTVDYVLTFARIFKGIFEGGWRNARENGKVELQTFSIKTQESITKTSSKFCQYQSFVHQKTATINFNYRRLNLSNSLAQE
jgi:hypothetical protein